MFYRSNCLLLLRVSPVGNGLQKSEAIVEFAAYADDDPAHWNNDYIRHCDLPLILLAFRGWLYTLADSYRRVSAKENTMPLEDVLKTSLCVGPLSFLP